ncbi:hypothetical protein MKW92_021894 [Papaver armeniacum]|nr:hypothetical protein MKW92_021894 [Papaver armeniacum]
MICNNNKGVLQEDNHDRQLGLYSYFTKGAALFKSSKPSEQNWKRDWREEDETSESAWVNVYGFYDEDTNSGGYGVIVRNMSAKPIAASVSFSRDGVTYLYQVLKGLDAGLKLALKHGCSSPRVVCNSRVGGRVLNHIASGFCGGLNCSGIKVNNVCQSCTMSMFPRMTEASFKSVAPLLETLQGKLHILNFTRKSRKWNKAAYYLAKRAKMTLLIYGRGFKDYKHDVHPEDIEGELLEILWKDAYDSVYYNLDAMSMIMEAG